MNEDSPYSELCESKLSGQSVLFFVYGGSRYLEDTHILPVLNPGNIIGMASGVPHNPVDSLQAIRTNLTSVRIIENEISRASDSVRSHWREPYNMNYKARLQINKTNSLSLPIKVVRFIHQEFLNPDNDRYADKIQYAVKIHHPEPPKTPTRLYQTPFLCP